MTSSDHPNVRPATAPIVSRRDGPADGDVLDVLGVRLRTLVNAHETGGAYASFEATIPPGVTVPLHTHAESEMFYVLAGELEFAGMGADGRIAVAPVRPGEARFIASRAPHSFRNATAADCRVLILGAGPLDAFFHACHAPAAPTAGPPSPEEVARVVAVMQRHGQELLGPHPVP
jgi:quercetin dioxygenase-like cupin family protein